MVFGLVHIQTSEEYSLLKYWLGQANENKITICVLLIYPLLGDAHPLTTIKP